MLADIAVGAPLRVVSMRYFNPIGADPQLWTRQQTRYRTHALGKLIEAHAWARNSRVLGLANRMICMRPSR
jgi:UDP-glucose 4-epimerase